MERNTFLLTVNRSLEKVWRCLRRDAYSVAGLVRSALYLVTLEVRGWSPKSYDFFLSTRWMPAFTGLDSWEFNFLLELVSPRGTAKRPSRVHAREAGMFEFNLPIHENRVDPFR